MAILKFKKSKPETEEISPEQDVLDVNMEGFYDELEDIDSEEELDLMSREETERHVDQLYDSGMDIEEIERIEYRRSAKLARQYEYRAKVQDRTDFLQALATPNMIGGYIFFYLVSVLYLWYTSGQLAFSLLVSLIGSVVLVYWFVFQENKLSIKQGELAELESLSRDITMQADVASNAYEVLEKMADKYKTGRVGNDVNMMYQKLRDTTEIDTSRFNLYNFTPVDVFMRNLEIWYTEGADSRKIFTRSVNGITYELLKRDELRKTNRSLLNIELMVVGMAISFPAIMRLFGGIVYDVFLGLPVVASIMMLVFYIGMLWFITRLKKRALDISIR